MGNVRQRLGWLGGTVLTMLLALPVRASEVLDFRYGPLQFNLPVQEMADFARTGKIGPNFSYLAKQATPEQLSTLRTLLRERFKISATTMSQLTYSQIGGLFLQRLGNILRTPADLDGSQAIRAALILAAVDRQGLTVLKVIQKFPFASVRVDLSQALELSGQVLDLTKLKGEVVDALEAQATKEAPPTSGTGQNLQLAGAYTWEQETIEADPLPGALGSGGKVVADVYLPRLPAGSTPPPVVAISHGIASSRLTFTYLARHLASWGFAVVAVEHPLSNSARYRQMLDTFATPSNAVALDFVSRPQEVSRVLDALERRARTDWRGRLDPSQVGLIGQSKGGFTVLSLAGAGIDFERLRADCTQYKDGSTSLNLSLLLQCQAQTMSATSAQLGDPRIKAVFSINPLDSSILGPKGLGQIQVPTLILAGSEDFVTPPLLEQIRAFYWLKVPERYLILMRGGTHFTSLGPEEKATLQMPPSLVGPDPSLAIPAVKALATAFFRRHLNGRPEFEPYLSTAYARPLAALPLRLSVVRSIDPTLVEKFGPRVVKLLGP